MLALTVGILAGGGEYGKQGIFQNNKDHPYSAGNGTIVSIKPCGFLVKTSDNVKIVGALETPYEKLIDKASEFISGLKQENEN